MATRILTLTAATCLLIGSSAVGFAQNLTSADVSTSKGQELTSTPGNSDPQARVIDSEKKGGDAKSEGTTGSNEHNESPNRPLAGADNK